MTIVGTTGGAPGTPPAPPPNPPLRGRLTESSPNSSSERRRPAAATFSSRCSTDEVPGIGEHRRRAGQKPGDRDLERGDAVGFGDPRDRPLVGDPAGLEREPGNEAEAVALAAVEHGLRVAFVEAVAVLDRDHGHDLAGALELLDVHVREPDVGDLPFVLKLG